MTEDLVKRLREEAANWRVGDCVLEAADLIERLTTPQAGDAVERVAHQLYDALRPECPAPYWLCERAAKALSAAPNAGLIEAVAGSIFTLEEQRRRCQRWGKSHAEIDAAITEARAALDTVRGG